MILSQNLRRTPQGMHPLNERALKSRVERLNFVNALATVSQARP